jgi:XTP/dITP diphosphohydrolase
VFGDPAQRDTDEASLAEQWEAIKAAEQERSGPFDGVPRSLPALSFAAKVLKRAERAGLPGPGTATVASDLGDRLLALVAECRAAGVDPELALRAATDRYVEQHERH